MKTFITIAVLALALVAPLVYAGQSPGQGMHANDSGMSIHKGKMGKNSMQKRMQMMQQMQAQESMGRGK